MPKRVLDTNVLIGHWLDFPGQGLAGRTGAGMQKWAKHLIELQDSNLIVTPVWIEVVAGVTNKEELKLTLAYLKPFKIIDDGRILPIDWAAARQKAQRIPPNGRRRQLGDCLIKAIADRLHCDVVTWERHFPR